MINADRLFHVVNDETLDRLTKTLAVIAFLGGVARTTAIEASLTANGVRKIKNWNVSQILRRANTVAGLTSDGWKLTSDGVATLRNKVVLSGDNLSKAAGSLRAHVEALPQGPLRDFVQEAIRCVEERLWRSAIVMSWLGAIRHLQDLVFAGHLRDFNAALQKRWPKSKAVTTVDGFSSIQEADFLLISEDIGFLDKSAKKLLGQRLDYRNAAGHPNSIKFDEEQVAAHVTFLINNAYRRGQA